MNINTLNAAHIEHKSNEVPFALYKNNFKSGKSQSYYARLISQGTCTDEDLACDIIAASLSSGLTKEKLLEIAALFRSAKIARLLTGCTVDDGITKCSLSLSGKFASQNESYSPERHTVSLSCNASSKLKPVIKEVTPVIRQGNSIFPVITEVLDLESKGSETLTRGGFLEIKGMNLVVAGGGTMMSGCILWKQRTKQRPSNWAWIKSVATVRVRSVASFRRSFRRERTKSCCGRSFFVERHFQKILKNVSLKANLPLHKKL